MGDLKNLDRLLEKVITMDPQVRDSGLQGKEAVYEGCVGLADLENNRPFKTDTICQMASMTKVSAVTAPCSF
jgi:CubicO group peptidase (beta-lactamase class C family)